VKKNEENIKKYKDLEISDIMEHFNFNNIKQWLKISYYVMKILILLYFFENKPTELKNSVEVIIIIN